MSEAAESSEAETEVRVVEIPPGPRERADKALAAVLPDFTRSQLQRLFGEGRVWREDTVLDKSQRLAPGDIIQIEIPPAQPLELRPVRLPLDILFEDADVIAINKAPGMVVHPGAGTGEDTLVHALLAHCGEDLPKASGVQRPGIVHRLDKETSGVIIVAKSDRAFAALAEDFAERRVHKEYLAIVCGPVATEGRTEKPIGRHPTQRTKMTVHQLGRPALTEWVVEARHGDQFALARVRIHTGRTHQIRVHFAHAGHPLAGDVTYGYRPARHGGDFPRVMLHAWRLRLAHPASGDPLSLEAPLPPDFAEAIQGFRDGPGLLDDV